MEPLPVSGWQQASVSSQNASVGVALAPSKQSLTPGFPERHKSQEYQ